MSLIEYTTGKHKVPSKAVQLPATLDGFTSLKDGSINIRFNTQEVTGEQLAVLKDYLNTFGWVLFKPSESSFTEEEMPDEDPKRLDLDKSPSQALRAAKYVYFTQKGGKPEDFNVWWAKWCERQKQLTLNELE